MTYHEVYVPFANARVWNKSTYGLNGHHFTSEVTEWIKTNGLYYYYYGFWIKNVHDADGQLLLFEKVTYAIMFKMIWG